MRMIKASTSLSGGRVCADCCHHTCWRLTFDANPRGFWRNNSRNFHHDFSNQFLRAGGEAATEFIGKSKPTVSNLIANNPILVHQKIDGMLLVLVEPSPDKPDEE
jgi:hypothetical protein